MPSRRYSLQPNTADQTDFTRNKEKNIVNVHKNSKVLCGESSRPLEEEFRNVLHCEHMWTQIC